MLDIVVLVSGGGTNLQTLIDRIEDGSITNGRIVKVISSRRDAFALERAKKHGIPTAVVPRGDYADAARYEAALHAEITAAAPGLIVLGGFLSKLSPQTVAMLPQTASSTYIRPLSRLSAGRDTMDSGCTGRLWSAG